MPDPIEVLSRLQQTAPQPDLLPAGEVRRRGDRRRRRRNGIVAAGVVVLLGAGGSTAFALHGQKDAGAPLPTTRTSAIAPVLGPDGYGHLRMGMDLAAARKTGDVTVTDFGPGETCTGFDYAHLPAPPKNSIGDGYLSRAHGVVAIFARGNIATPQGIHLGSSQAEVKAAYPTAKQHGFGSWYVPVAGHPGVSYRYDLKGGKVTQLQLEASDQDCYE